MSYEYLCNKDHLDEEEHAGPAQGAVQPPCVEGVQVGHLQYSGTIT